jgi:hypothetical protein
VNIYTIEEVNGRMDDIEADFCERVGDDWVFYAGLQEVFRIPIESVVGVMKAPKHVEQSG